MRIWSFQCAELTFTLLKFLVICDIEDAPSALDHIRLPQTQLEIKLILVPNKMI